MPCSGLCVSWASHNVDEFVTLGPQGSRECESNVDIMHGTCDEVGLPAEPEKDEGPAIWSWAWKPADIEWWYRYLETWNGMAMMSSTQTVRP